MKLEGKIDGGMITAKFFPDYVGEEYEINQGLCMAWAYVAYFLYEDVFLISNRFHAWAKQGNLYFDSESPEGIKNWKKLECNVECWSPGVKTYRYTDIERFKHKWKGNRIDWSWFESKAQKLLRKLNRSHRVMSSQVELSL
jgi:hypothetical protein